MATISSLRIFSSTDILGLYVNPVNSLLSDLWISPEGIQCKKGAIASFNTYFNSIYETYLTKYTTLSNLFYRLRLEGSFKVTVYREIINTQKTAISHHEFLNCSLNSEVILPVSLSKDHQKAGRIYLELECLSDSGKISESTLETTQEQSSVVSLAIITCTYKKEQYIQRTVQKILNYPHLKKKQFKIFVIDNGQTLTPDQFLDERVVLIHNQNVGGSGGFTKGLIMSLEPSEQITHCLLMDDDIEIDEEVILRVFSLYEYATKPFIITGSMLDNYKKHLLYESGGKYGFRQSKTLSSTLETDLLASAHLRHNLYLQDSSTLNTLLREEEFDCSGFWFFAVPKNIIQDIGLLLPFFIKVDDLEYGLRLKEKKINAVAFPGIAVWHDPFYAKRQVQWAEYYYYVRNRLISNAIHRNYSAIQTIPRLTKRFMGRLMIFDYAGAELCLQAIQDYIKGEKSLTDLPLEVKHQYILDISNKYGSGLISSEMELPNLSENYSNENSKVTFFRKALSLITLNGHLLPHFMLDHENPAVGSLSNDDWTKVSGRSRILIYDINAGVFEKKILHQRGLQLFIQWLCAMTHLFISWRKLRNSWRKAFPKLITETFWKSFLEPKQNL